MAHPENGKLCSTENKWAIKTWKDMKTILNVRYKVKEVSLKKATDFIIVTIWHSGKGKPIESVKRSVVAGDCWGGRNK